MYSLNKVWKNTEILPWFLIFFIITIFVILPFSNYSKLFQIIFTVFLALNTVLGVISINSNPTIKKISFLFAFLVTCIEIISIESESLFFRVFSLFCWISLFCCLLYIFLKKVFETKNNNIHRIQGGIACYLILGIIFSLIHSLIFHYNPNAYSVTIYSLNNVIPYEFIYYSYTTLTTTGYGDITPLIPISQSASILEEVIGVLFPTILIGYLISDSTSNKP